MSEFTFEKLKTADKKNGGCNHLSERNGAVQQTGN